MSAERAVFRDLNLIGNFSNERVSLGNIYQMDDGDFVLLGNISDFDPSIQMDEVTEASGVSDRELWSVSDISIHTHASAKQPIARDEIELLVKRSNSGVVILSRAVTHSLKAGLVKKKLLDIWKKEGFMEQPMRYCVCNQVLHAAAGTVLISCESNNRVVMKHRDNLPLPGLPALLDGKVSVERHSKKMNKVISPGPFEPVFQALRIKKHRQGFEIVG